MDKDNKKIFSADGTEVKTSEIKTTRSLERDEEDKHYIPVILKRNDGYTTHPDDTLQRAIEHGLEQHKRSMYSLFLSGMAAGLILGFAAMCVAISWELFPPETNPILNKIFTALLYPLGFIICIMSGTQLFTEQTATAVYPVLDKKIKFKSLGKLWAAVLLGNFTGTFLSSLLLFAADNVINAKVGYIDLANHLIHFTSSEIFISSVLAGWLMAQGGWLVLSTASPSGQIISIFIVTFIIGLGGLHHSIAGSAEIFSGLMHSTNPNYLASAKFLLNSVLGNLVGGSFFVGILNYGHIRRSQSL